MKSRLAMGIIGDLQENPDLEPQVQPQGIQRTGDFRER